MAKRKKTASRKNPLRQQVRAKDKEILFWKKEVLEMESTIKAKNIMLKDWASWIKELTGMDDDAMNEAVSSRLADELKTDEEE